VEKLARTGDALSTPSIGGIADYRMANVAQMDTDLVRAPGEQMDLHQIIVFAMSVWRGKILSCAVHCDGLSPIWDNGHSFPIVGIAADGLAYPSLRLS
jgi:hypothetical protein